MSTTESDESRADGVRRRSRAPVLAGIVLALTAVAVLGYVLWARRGDSGADEPKHAASGDLRITRVVPTLDAPLAAGENAIWCSTFIVAWKRMESDVLKTPARIANVDADLLDRLNNAPQSETDLPAGSFYAAAGKVNAIVPKIQSTMAARYSQVPAPTFSPGAALVAYAYLEAGIAFTIPFFDNDDEFIFTDSAGRGTDVAAFGLRSKDGDKYMQLREQVDILYAKSHPTDGSKALEFVVDPCKDSSPNQILLAKIPRQETLAAAVEYVERKIEEATKDEHYKYVRELGPTDDLLIPRMNWMLSHRFSELEGEDKLLLNPGFEGLWLSTAQQDIRFKLDRGGVELGSEARVVYAATSRLFPVNGPYLILMRKRGAAHPHFAMWVDNAELLQPR